MTGCLQIFGLSRSPLCIDSANIRANIDRINDLQRLKQAL